PAPQRAPARDREARRLAGRAPARLSVAPPWPLAGGVMPMTSSEAVANALLLKRDGAVLLITLNRPERCNAVNRQMWRELREAFIGARADAGPARRGGDRQRRVLLCRPGPGRDDGRGLRCYSCSDTGDTWSADFPCATTRGSGAWCSRSACT